MVGKSDYNENAVVSLDLDLDLDFGLQLRVCQYIQQKRRIVMKKITTKKKMSLMKT